MRDLNSKLAREVNRLTGEPLIGHWFDRKQEHDTYAGLNTHMALTEKE